MSSTGFQRVLRSHTQRAEKPPLAGGGTRRPFAERTNTAGHLPAAKALKSGNENVAGNLQHTYTEQPSLSVTSLEDHLPSLPQSGVPRPTIWLDRHQESVQSATDTTQQALPSSSSTLEPLIPDVDSVDSRNPLAVSGYATSIYQSMLSSERLHAPNPKYLDKAPGGVSHALRAAIIGWVNSAHFEFGLYSETFFLQVSLFDRFLAKYPVTKAHLELVGATCLFIVAKYEEIQPPSIADLVTYMNFKYTREDVLTAEVLVLNTVKCVLNVPTALMFARRFSKVAQMDKPQKFQVYYFIELSTLDFRLAQFLPSLIAAASTCLALVCQSTEIWTHALECHSGYSLHDLAAAVVALHDMAQKVPLTGPATKMVKKYSTSDYVNVAALPIVPLPLSILELVAQGPPATPKGLVLN